MTFKRLKEIWTDFRWNTGNGSNVKPGVFTEEEFRAELEAQTQAAIAEQRRLDALYPATSVLTEESPLKQLYIDDELEAFEMDEDTYMEQRAFGNA